MQASTAAAREQSRPRGRRRHVTYKVLLVLPTTLRLQVPKQVSASYTGGYGGLHRKLLVLFWRQSRQSQLHCANLIHIIFILIVASLSSSVDLHLLDLYLAHLIFLHLLISDLDPFCQSDLAG